jgi:hypothetical protein
MTEITKLRASAVRATYLFIVHVGDHHEIVI